MGNDKEQNQQQSNTNNQNEQRKPFDTPAFVKSILDQLGCKCEENQTNELEIVTTFQGEKFAIRAMVGYPFVRIHDMWWNSVEMEQVQEVEKARVAVNQINGAMPGYTVVYNFSPEEKLMGIHTMAEVLMIDAIPDAPGYLKRIFEGFFQQKRNFFDCLKSINEAEKANSNTGNEVKS